MKTFLKDYFYFTPKEFNGFLILIGLMMLITILRHTIDFTPKYAPAQLPEFEPIAQKPLASKETNTLFYFNPNEATKEDFLRLGLSERTAQSILNYRKKGGFFKKPSDLGKIYTLSTTDFERLKPFITLPSESKTNFERPSTPTVIQPIEPFNFDPNTATKEIFQQLGLSERTAQSILNYRKKGGYFKKPSDLEKIYTLSTTDFERLKPFITLEKTEAKAEKIEEVPLGFATKPSFQPTKITSIDINKADETTWQTLRGIGPAYANRIVKFRIALGGFSSIEQVGECYGLPDSTFQKIKPFLTHANFQLIKINLNEVDAKTLKQHPYLQWKHANAIVNYRAQHGNFQTIEDLKKIKIITAEIYNKIEPYLTVQ